MRRRLSIAAVLAAIAVQAGCGASSTPTAPTPTASAAPVRVAVTVGCYSASYAGLSNSQIGCGLLNGFGDPIFDQAFASESDRQDQFFGFVVPVSAFDECAGRQNALSFPAGFILYGRNLFYDALLKDITGAGIAGTLAHEYAHQVQFRMGWMRPNDSTARVTEMEADAFSGYYFRLAKGLNETQIRGYLSAIQSKGDYLFNNPQHHGTPNNRLGAALLGMVTADDAIKRNTRFTYQQLHDYFIAFITTAAAPSIDGASKATNQLLERALLDPSSVRLPSIEPDRGQRAHLFPRE